MLLILMVVCEYVHFHILYIYVCNSCVSSSIRDQGLALFFCGFEVICFFYVSLWPL